MVIGVAPFPMLLDCDVRLATAEDVYQCVGPCEFLRNSVRHSITKASQYSLISFCHPYSVKERHQDEYRQEIAGEKKEEGLN